MPWEYLAPALAAVAVAAINMIGSVLLRWIDAHYKHADKAVEVCNGKRTDVHTIERTPELRNGGPGVPVPRPSDTTHTGATPAS